MRTIEYTSAFRRDFKREKRGQHRHHIDALVSVIVSLLAEDKAVPEKLAIMPCLASGATIANATSSLICY
jgi:mRNA-degrading endonuclease YafQ of YafQ-DinJ toxin-antitoxin module